MASACTAASTTATVVFIDDVTADQTRMKSQVSPQSQLNAVNRKTRFSVTEDKTKGTKIATECGFSKGLSQPL